MASKAIQWQDGSGDVLSVSYEGNGNGMIRFSSTTCQGKDRTATATVSNGYGQSVGLTITQIGLRQPFSGSGGGFLLNGGGTFNVLK